MRQRLEPAIGAPNMTSLVLAAAAATTRKPAACRGLMKASRSQWSRVVVTGDGVGDNIKLAVVVVAGHRRIRGVLHGHPLKMGSAWSRDCQQGTGAD